MITCEYDGVPFTEPRAHPWTDATSSPNCRYYDFKANPALIRSALEDFVPFRQEPAIEQFFGLLEWLNGPSSTLETNDCAFSGPAASESPAMGAARSCSGRLMVMHRALAANVDAGRVELLKNELHRALAPLGPELTWGIIGTTLVPVRYLSLPSGGRLGHQLMISFWSFGASDAEVMDNLGRVIGHLTEALRSLSP